VTHGFFDYPASQGSSHIRRSSMSRCFSPSLLRKKRLQGPGDPQAPGLAYIQLSSSLIVYTIADLDAWLDAQSYRNAALGAVHKANAL
jgi:hypothetical protein